MEWIRGAYKDKQVGETIFITGLTHLHTEGRYNVYETMNGKCIVVFSDQRELLQLVSENQGSVYAIKLLDSHSPYYTYNVNIEGRETKVYTLARAAIIVPGSFESPRTINISHYTISVQ